MTDIDLVLSGSGTLAPCHVGAVARLYEAGFCVRRVAGTSGGAIVAAAIAHKFDVDKMLNLSRRLLQNDMLLDAQATWYRPWGFFNGYGINRFDVAHKAFAKEIPGRMEDASIEWGVFCVDLEVARPIFISSRRHGHVHSADAVIASSSIPVFARMREVRGMRGAFVDGGAATNFGIGVFDDEPERPTIGIRFRPKPIDRSRIRSLVGFGRSLASVLMDNANRTHISTKRYADVIEIESDGDGLDFDLSLDEVNDRFAEGYDAADAWLTRRDEVIA